MKKWRDIHRPQVNARALGADCDTCPFDGQRPTVATESKSGPPRVTVLLEGAGDMEEILGKAAQGKTGTWLNFVWRQLGITREEAAVRNATMCKPTRQSSEGSLRQAVECCRPRLARELSVGNPGQSPDRRNLARAEGSTAVQHNRLEQRHLVLVCGGKALQSITGKTVIDDWRGYPVEPTSLWSGGNPAASGLVFFPTYHPAFVMRKPQYIHIFLRDLRRAWGYANGTLDVFKWPPLYTDNGDAAEQFLFEICERLEAGESCAIGVDVETKGDWTTRLLLLGIATEEGSTSLLYPFANEHLDAYARFILAHPNATLVVQNGNHDALSLERHGFKLSPRRWDTIVAGRVCYPDLPHDLGFLATLFFFCNRWKSEFHAGSSQDKKGGEGWDRYLREDYIERFLLYNACDAASQILMKKPLERRLKHVPK